MGMPIALLNRKRKKPLWIDFNYTHEPVVDGTFPARYWPIAVIERKLGPNHMGKDGVSVILLEHAYMGRHIPLFLRPWPKKEKNFEAVN